MMNVVCSRWDRVPRPKAALAPRHCVQCCSVDSRARESEGGTECARLEITYLMTEIYSCPMIDAFLIYFPHHFWFYFPSSDGRQTQTACTAKGSSSILGLSWVNDCAGDPALAASVN